jgi:hypothetical protein
MELKAEAYLNACYEHVLGSICLHMSTFLTSGLVGSERSASGPGRFNKDESSSSFTYWVGGLVEPQGQY